MPKLGTTIKYAILAVLVLIVLVVILSFITQLGDKTIADETIVLPAGSQKTYNLPPGYSYIEFQSSVPVDDLYESLDGNGDGHYMSNRSKWSGSLFFGKYTIINNGKSDATVNLLITTGVLNPYSYI